MITYEEFTKVNLKSGIVVKAEKFVETRNPAFKVWVDFGSEIGILQTSAQITVNYSLEALVGKQVIRCVNLGEKNIAGFKSQFLLVGFADEKGAISLATIDHKVSNGQKLH